MQVQSSLKLYNYKNGVHAATEILKQEGWKGLYRVSNILVSQTKRPTAQSPYLPKIVAPIDLAVGFLFLFFI